MVINNLVAGLCGHAGAGHARARRVDPAVSSAVFVTMVTDVMGFFSFLGLATLWGLEAREHAAASRCWRCHADADISICTEHCTDVRGCSSLPKPA